MSQINDKFFGMLKFSCLVKLTHPVERGASAQASFMTDGQKNVCRHAKNNIF
jgi:hypothetical protein